MQFSDKLTYLFNVAAVRNTELARALHIDASQISRLRNGKRSMPKKQEVLRSIADFFAERCQETYKREALAKAMGRLPSKESGKTSALSDALLQWLCDEPTRAASDQLMRVLDGMAIMNEPAPGERGKADAAPSLSRIRVQSGNSGKRKAFLDLLNRLLQEKTPRTLLIASDECANWMFEDEAYSHALLDTLLALARRGFQIHNIIPPITDINAAFDMFSLWLPIYMTCNVQPYYYPRLRDGVYRRTLIVAPGIMAMMSTSVGWREESGVTFVYTDAAVVESFARDFEQYRAMCRPAITFYDPAKHAEALTERMRKYYASSMPSIRIGGELSFLTMPRAQKRMLRQRSRSPLLRLLCGHVDGGVIPREYDVYRRSITDIMSLASIEDIYAGRARYSLDDEIAYSPAEYRAHFEGIVTLLERHELFQVMLTNRSALACTIYAKESEGTMILLHDPPYMAMDVSSPFTASAMWDYLRNISDPGYSPEANRRRVLVALRQHIARLPGE